MLLAQDWPQVVAYSQQVPGKNVLLACRVFAKLLLHTEVSNSTQINNFFIGSSIPHMLLINKFIFVLVIPSLLAMRETPGTLLAAEIKEWIEHGP